MDFICEVKIKRMKKIVLSSISSLLAAMGLSSFTGSNFPPFSYYWFYAESPVAISVIHPTFAQIGGDYLGYSTQANISNAPFCSGTGALCLVGYTLGSISGFTSGGTPTGFKTMGGAAPGEPRPYATRGSTTQFFQ